MVREPLTEQEITQGRRVGALLRAARGPRTLSAVARGAGLSVETLRKIETGRIPTPAFVTVAALATELELSLDEIWRAAREEATHARPAAS
ncbi:MAG TPA: helix-turn-helix transcriptional regulator [Micromonosporaceae bacterium]|nr:helix-turn-helix transcriptional regulator [Micromonosporaceae bacterium]